MLTKTTLHTSRQTAERLKLKGLTMPRCETTELLFTPGGSVNRFNQFGIQFGITY